MSSGDRPKLEFSGLVSRIEELHRSLKDAASKSVNMMLTLRNWLIGYYIAEYELQGSDRADYGDKTIECLANELKKLDVPRTDKRELYRYLKFYNTYPQIVETVSPQLQCSVNESITSLNCPNGNQLLVSKIVDSPSPQLYLPVGHIFTLLSLLILNS